MVPYRDLQSRIKPVVGDLPVVMCTRIQTPDQADDILSAGEADLIGFCRAFVVDPDWPNKARSGRRHTIRRCIACNQCWGWISEGGPIGCAINPTLGMEHKLGRIEPAHMKKRVLVIGGGPGGLEAARVAALRGHDVTLVEREPELGGRIRTARLAPSNAELGHVTDFLVPQVEELGLRILTNTEADLPLIEREKPDSVILATGANALVPDIDGDGTVPVITSDGTIDPALLGSGDTVIVMDEDGYFWPAAVAEAAAALGKSVLVLTRFFEPFREMPVVSRISTLRELDKLGATMRPNMYVNSIADGGVVLRHYQSGREEIVPDCAAVIWIGLQRANDGLAQVLRDQSQATLAIVGDAYAPRRHPQAIRDGHNAARPI